jgi:acetyl-CoA acetyltransferase
MMASTAYVVGTGVTKFGKFFERAPASLGQEAVLAALRDSGVPAKDINVAFCGAVNSAPGLGQRTLKDLGITGIPVQNLENACASSASAVLHAAAWIGAGMADVALCFGIEKMSSPVPAWETRDPIQVFAGGWVTVYAMKANKKMTQSGLTARQLAAVAVKNRFHASLNENAQFRDEITLEQVLESRAICDPLTLLQCCPPSDGAAALIVVSEKAMRKYGLSGQAIRIAGIGMGSGHSLDRGFPEVALATRVSREVYEASGIGPEDVDLCEVHDAFTIGEILQTEELGICPPGEGGAYAETGKTRINGGRTAVNVGGGLLSRGHPLGATGAAQIAEIVNQLRKRAGSRQVEGARVGLASAAGGSVYDLEANANVVTVLTV